uniref:Uncharacterized protein n=1 Tax=Erwinia piriflorinigrans CFBP 5888 TaxID=1161919 RepID=V5Z2L7_9GAMM|nr:hypothetical protein [Erwinia piriflorinigrans]CCG55411.1 hypothetical protein EPIR_pEPIR37034 [Erwinia piriflorinigrans CFBP 5888]
MVEILPAFCGVYRQISQAMLIYALYKGCDGVFFIQVTAIFSINVTLSLFITPRQPL